MYQLTAGSFSLDGTEYLSYGIRFGDIRYDDLSPDRHAVEQLVALCNSEALDKSQLYDVVCDFVAGAR